MLQCDEDEETKTIESGDKCFASEDKSNADVSKATDTSNLKELLLLRNGMLPVLHDGENNNSGESTGLGANCGDEGDINNPSFWNSVLNDRSCNSSISTQTADEQSFLVSSSSHGGSGLQDVRELSENQVESAENPPETTETSEDSADIVDISDENKNLAYKEGNAKKTRQLNMPYEGIRNSQIQRYSNCIEYSSSYISSGSCDSEKLHRSSPYEGEMVTHIADETCCEETGFGNEDLVLAETNQQLPKGSSGLARGMLVEDGEAFSLVSGRSGISVESSSESHNLSADIEKNAMKMNRERKLSEKDEGREGKDVISMNATVDGLKKSLNDVEEQSTERDNIAQMDDLCQKQIENLTLRQSGGSSSSLSELQTLNAGIRNECSDVKCEKVLDSKACFSMEVVQELNKPEKEALFSDCGEDKRLDMDALMMVIGPDFEGASLDDATERDLDRSLPVPVGKTIACHLPSLEDGLSSGHASDSDEMAASRQAEGPGDGLSLAQKTEVQVRPALLASSQLSRGTVEGIHVSVDPVSEARKKDVHLAIQDIKSAIEKSKTVKLISPSVGDEEQPKEADEYRSVEPVWITRKEQAKDLQRQTPKNQNKPSTSPPETANSHKTSKSKSAGKEYSTDDETDELLNKQYVQSAKLDIPELSTSHANQSQDERQKSRAREVALRDPTNEAVLIEGVLFRASYLGSTQLVSEGQPSKRMRTAQAQEAVNRIKAPEGETQPSTEVDLFISAEKIMVLNTDLQEIMMDHALRTISYIADIGEILVVMARRSPTVASASDKSSAQRRSQTKLCCHVFESDEAQLIAQSIGRAFHTSYVEFLKANGIDNPSHIQDLDYQEVLNQQEIFSEELSLFSNREMQKEVTVSKAKGEPLGVVIVESGWGSLLPTVVLANMSPVGAAARCGQLNIGDQIMSIDGVSLVGLPLATCQSHIKSVRNQLVVKLVVVSCPPVVEVLIKRPDVKYQLGFSVQDGVICSLLRGGIAERGGVRVGHRIIEINGRSVVAISHETIVELLAASVGEIQMRTMPTSIFQLLTGQDVPHYI